MYNFIFGNKTQHVAGCHYWSQAPLPYLIPSSCRRAVTSSARSLSIQKIGVYHCECETSLYYVSGSQGVVWSTDKEHGQCRFKNPLSLTMSVLG